MNRKLFQSMQFAADSKGAQTFLKAGDHLFIYVICSTYHVYKCLISSVTEHYQNFAAFFPRALLVERAQSHEQGLNHFDYTTSVCLSLTEIISFS